MALLQVCTTINKRLEFQKAAEDKPKATNNPQCGRRRHRSFVQEDLPTLEEENSRICKIHWRRRPLIVVVRANAGGHWVQPFRDKWWNMEHTRGEGHARCRSRSTSPRKAERLRSVQVARSLAVSKASLRRQEAGVSKAAPNAEVRAELIMAKANAIGVRSCEAGPKEWLLKELLTPVPVAKRVAVPKASLMRQEAGVTKASLRMPQLPAPSAEELRAKANAIRARAREAEHARSVALAKTLAVSKASLRTQEAGVSKAISERPQLPAPNAKVRAELNAKANATVIRARGRVSKAISERPQLPVPSAKVRAELNAKGNARMTRARGNGSAEVPSPKRMPKRQLPMPKRQLPMPKTDATPKVHGGGNGDGRAGQVGCS